MKNRMLLAVLLTSLTLGFTAWGQSSGVLHYHSPYTNPKSELQHQCDPDKVNRLLQKIQTFVETTKASLTNLTAKSQAAILEELEENQTALDPVMGICYFKGSDEQALSDAFTDLRILKADILGTVDSLL